jgi:hypothetical protein
LTCPSAILVANKWMNEQINKYPDWMSLV